MSTETVSYVAIGGKKQKTRFLSRWEIAFMLLIFGTLTSPFMMAIYRSTDYYQFKVFKETFGVDISVPPEKDEFVRDAVVGKLLAIVKQHNDGVERRQKALDKMSTLEKSGKINSTEGVNQYADAQNRESAATADMNDAMGEFEKDARIAEQQGFAYEVAACRSSLLDQKIKKKK